MSTTTYTVTGMTCDHCVRAVKEEIGQISGVTGVTVDLETGEVTVSGTGMVAPDLVRGAVEEAGYEVRR